MEDFILLCREYWYLAIIALYFTLGRLALLAAVVFRIGPLAGSVSIIIGLELVQIPFFFHFFTVIRGLFRKIKSWFHRRRTIDPDAEEVAEKDGFFMRKFRKKGASGVLVLASLPFKGCGVWSSVFLGRSLELPKRMLYGVVTGGTLAGNIGLVLFGLVFNRSAIAFIQSLEINPAIRSLFE